MNWHRVTKIIFSLAAIYLLFLQPQPSIAHSGHQHQPEHKSVGQPPSEISPVAPDIPQIPPSPPVRFAPVNQSNSTTTSWLPQPEELLLLLLVTGPFGLFYLKHMLYQRE